MVDVTLRFVEFMDARPLPGGVATLTLLVAPRWRRDINDDPGDDGDDPPIGSGGPSGKPVIVPVPDLSLAVTFTRDVDTDALGVARTNFPTRDEFAALAQTSDADGRPPDDVVASLTVGFAFMGFDLDARTMPQPIASSGTAVSHTVPVDFGMAIVGHTTADTTRLWFALNEARGQDQEFRCVVVSRPDRAESELTPLQGLTAGVRHPVGHTLDDGGRVVHDSLAEVQRRDGTAVVDVDGLGAADVYHYELRVLHAGREFPLLLGGVTIASEAERERLAFSFGSCHLPTTRFDTSIDQAADESLQSIERWRHLASRRDDALLLLLGDQIYGDGIERHWPELGWFDRYQRRYRQLWSYRPMRDVLRRTCTYMTLDDHDVVNDFGVKDIDPLRVTDALAAYRSFQHARNPGPIDGPLPFSFRRGPASYFVMDGRTDRRPGRPGLIGAGQRQALRDWAASEETRAADVIFFCASVPFSLLPTELVRQTALQAIEDASELAGAAVGALAGAVFGGPFAGIVLGAVGHEIGPKVAEHLGPDIEDSLLLKSGLVERWDVAENQSDMVAVLDLLFDLANGIGIDGAPERPRRRRAVFILAGDVHIGTMHAIRSLPRGNGRRHIANPVITQLTSSPISHDPVDERAYTLAVSRLDDSFDLRLKDLGRLALFARLADLIAIPEGIDTDDLDKLEKLAVDTLDERLRNEPSAYTLDSVGERRFRTQLAGLLLERNTGRVVVEHVGPGRRYRFRLAIEGRGDSLEQVVEMDLESPADEIPRFSANDTLSTHIYLTVRSRASGAPLDGVRVRVMDQDAPAPRGDDVEIPELSETTVSGKSIKTVQRTVREPAADQQLAEGRTDRFGTLWLRLSPADRATTAGTVTTTTTIDKVKPPGGGGRPGGIPGDGPVPRPAEPSSQTHTTTRALSERAPDLYFLITLANGGVVDTRGLDDGFFVNQRGDIGSAEQPLVFTLGPRVDVGTVPPIGGTATPS